MSTVFRRSFKIGALTGVAGVIACFCAAVWALRSAPIDWPDNEIPLGNKGLIAYRSGLDFRVALVFPTPWFSIYALAPGEKRPPDNVEWGQANHWLKLPNVDFSLGWPLAASLALGALWPIQRRFTAHRGFPVECLTPPERTGAPHV